MFEQMQALMTTISNLQIQVSNNNNNNNSGGNNYRSGRNYNSGRGNRGGQGRGRGRNQGQGHGREQTGRQPQQYCWTHGNCHHSGADCESKAEGHINGATYENRQNGSNARCNGADS